MHAGMTILDVGRCLGTGKPPLEGSEKRESERSTGICGTCSGRFDLDDGLLVPHEPAPGGERESREPDEEGTQP
jgi:hypothetical protein